MSVSFIFMVAVLNLGLGFGAAVVIKRRSETLIARPPVEHAATEPHAKKLSASHIGETAAEAIEAVEELLSQVGLQLNGSLETDPADEADSGDDDETDSEDALEAADVDLQSLNL